MTILYGAEYIANDSYTSSVMSAKLDSTHILVAYGYNGTVGDGFARIGTINGTEISFATAYAFSLGVSEISIVVLDATHVLIAFKHNQGSNYGTAIIGTISGTDISYGTPYVFNSANTSYIIAMALDSTHVLITYQDTANSNYGTAIIATISGTDIAYGSEYVFNSASTIYLKSIILDSTHALITYRDGGNSNYGTGIIAAISETTISYGSEYVFNTAQTSFINCVYLDTTHILIEYRDDVDSNYGTAIIATISGTDIAYGSEYVFETGAVSDVSIIMVNSTQAVIAYSNPNNTFYGTSIIATISGTEIFYGTKDIYNTAHTYYISSVLLDSAHLVISYADDGNSDFATAIIGTAPLELSAEQHSTHIDISWINSW